MIKFSFSIGIILTFVALIGVSAEVQRWVMGLCGLFLVLFSSYLKFYVFALRRPRNNNEKNLEDQPSLDLNNTEEKINSESNNI